MIYVDVAKLALPEGWQEKAKAAKAVVEAADDDKRADAISSHSDVWGALKDACGNVSDDKCWYCETIWNRDDFAMDHYRPKRAVHGVPQHKGYYWLCFASENLMFSCKYCNERREDKEKEFTGGKGSFFPLAAEGIR
jgi:hypothetical protein